MTTDTQETTMTRTETAAALYFEVRGAGDPMLLIPGTPGDGGQFDALADVLADHRTVITYDRAGASRSALASAATVADHADDAAGLLRARATRPAVVYGTSNGAMVALELALRHPSLVERVILHEPPLLSVLADPAPVGAMLGEMIGSAMQRGGPPAALDAFLRFAFGDDVVAGWPAELRERMLANAESVFGVELPAFQAYRPDEQALADLSVPVTVAVGRDQGAPFFLEAAEWIAARAGAEVVRTPGAHGPQFTCPAELARALLSTT
ncbi:MAG TPA: alpha/beta hydrolase [Solirubrobacterales bacterium]|nr:alpha/beta hydrolase [Solirubrobacterales bacterium]